MKLKNTIAACALALAAMSGSALASPGYDAADFAPSTALDPIIDVYLTGASAPQNFLGAMAETLFGANAVIAGVNQYDKFTVFYDNGVSGSIGASYRGYMGRLSSAQAISASWGEVINIPANTRVRLLNRAKGGSVWGVNPLARHQNVAWMPMTDVTGGGNCTYVGNATYKYTCGQAGNDLALTGRIPDFGVSDVEPDMFKGPYNVEFGQTELAPAELSNLTKKPTVALLFGAAVTTNVPAGVPFNRSSFSGILNGSIGDWTQLDSTIGAPSQMVVCRRVQGSGTQATYNAYFSKFPCGQGSVVPGAVPPLRMANSASYTETATTITVDPSAGLTVVENPSSGNVRDCLTKARNGGIHTFTSDNGKAVSVNFGAGGYKAVGTLSLDSAPTANWAFRDLNGVPANKANMRVGTYDFFGEVSMQVNNQGYAPFNAATNTPGSWVADATQNDGTPWPAIEKQRRAFTENFIDRASNPAILNLMPAGVFKDNTAALPTNPFFAPDESSAEGLNTTYVTYLGNACSPIQRY